MCEITTSPLVRPRDIAIGTSDMQAGRLRAGSKARTDRLATMDERLFLRTHRPPDRRQAGGNPGGGAGVVLGRGAGIDLSPNEEAFEPCRRKSG